MKELSEITCGFVDHGGLYQPLAERLAESYKRVIYTDPAAEDSENINEAIIGDSFPENPRFERTDDIWLHKTELDLVVVPDSKAAGLQLEFQSQGFPVWGSRRSIFLEQSRETFIRVLEDLGFEVPSYKRIIGITALREYLEGKEDQIIKISKYRKTMETKKWSSWDEDEWWLDLMAVKLGGLKELFPFLVFESIDTPFEIGGDTYVIDGRYPRHMLDGYEAKDNAYFSAFKAMEEQPEQIQAVMEAFAPLLKKTGHRNFWTMEIRVKGEKFYFIDNTPRGPKPANDSQIAIIKNLPLIIAAGAEGELIEPEASALFSAEVALCKKGSDIAWRSTRVPEELTEWMKLSGFCRVNGRAWIPYREKDDEGIGWLVATGNTPHEVVTNILAYKALLPPGVDAATDGLVELLKEINKAEEEGMEFTDKPVPEPEMVVTEDAK